MRPVVEARLRYFQDLFGLANWTITVKEGPLAQNAMTFADPRYNRASITINQTLVLSDPQWDELLVHELIHVIMAMYDYFADNLGQEGTDNLFFIAREKSVSELTTIFMRILKRGDQHG